MKFILSIFYATLLIFSISIFPYLFYRYLICEPLDFSPISLPRFMVYISITIIVGFITYSFRKKNRIKK